MNYKEITTDTDNLIKRVILIIWAIWSLIVALSNMTDALKALGLFPGWFGFASGNFLFIQSATKIYSLPVWINAILFFTVIVWEVFLCAMFFKAVFNVKNNDSRIISMPFILGIILFGGFLIMDELLIAYDRLGAIEQSHLSFMAALMISFLVIRIISKK